jgi:ABC-type nitrate/sulfonate/bicarbonate transport system permease component
VTPARRLLIALLGILGLLVLWEVLVRAAGATGIAPTPTGALAAGFEALRTGRIEAALRGSLERVVIGIVVGAAIGIPVGLMLGLLPAVDRGLRPIVDGLRSIAPIAWIPMAILWLGVRGDAALFVVTYAAVFPFALYTGEAARRVDRRLVQAARALGARGALLVASVVLPSALPSMLTATRIALAFAWGSINAAELTIGIKGAGGGVEVAGIGQLMVETLYVRRDVNALVFEMLVIGLVSFAIDAGVRRLQRLLVPWGGR